MKRIKLLLAAGVVGLASALPAETIVLSNRYGRAAVETLGARVVSYVPAGGAETLALLSAGAGGIPLCWPWFQFNGPDGEASPKHGLARYREFEKVSVTQHPDASEAVLRLRSDAATRRLFPHDFELTLTVRLGASLDLALTGVNTGSDAFAVTEAFHPYLLRTAVPQLRDTGGGTFRTWDPDRTSHLRTQGIGPEDWQKFICVENGTFRRESAYTLGPGASHTLTRTIGPMRRVDADETPAFEDEPDELNWDSLGGTLTGFRHLRGTCAADADFARRLLGASPVERLPERLETVWITPDAFTNAVINQWGFNVVQGEKCLSAPGGHCVGLVRIPVEVPADGCYRVWTRYWHDKGSAGSFAVALEDGSLAENPDASLSVVQDAWSWRFDFVEFARRQNPLPDYRQEPTGFRWEASPTVRLKKGRRTLSLSGLVHDGPYGGRNVAAVVLTREPLAVPEMPAGEGAVRVGCAAPSSAARETRAIWERRPQIAEGTSDLKPLWREWRARFFADLVAGKIEGVEAGRMAATVYFDEESNLVGTPRQVADEKAAMRKFLAEVDRTHFKLRLEAESFAPGKEGWWTEASSGASGGKILVTGWWAGECDASAEASVPTNGNYTVWMRYMEIAGYLAKYSFLVEDAEGKVVAEKILAADDAYNRSHGGLNWVKLDVPLAAGKFRVRVRKTDAGLTYRRVDEVIVTDDPAYVPEGEGIALQPLDDSKPLTVWRPNDPWLGFSRVSAPLAGEGLAPYATEIREGEAESILVLVRNNTDAARDATPRVSPGGSDIVRWRVVGFVQSGWAGWQPMPLFARDALVVPPGETAGVWLTVTGRRRGSERTVKVEIGDETLALDVKCTDAHGPDVPVPYVFGWAAPYRTVSCWELFRDLGVNVINDVLVPKAEAEKYGVRLTVHLNDGDVSEGHVKYLNERFAKMGYAKADWAWSFMDEPGNSTADTWTNLATRVRALDPEVKIWVNPGEFENAGPEACMKITPFANIYCPYCNHFQTNGGHNPAYNEQLQRKGPKFDLLLGYTTPCFGEKAPSAPLDLLGMRDFAIGCNLDGWAFFALAHGFTYSNSLWDEVNAYMGDQCVNIYPGAANRTISTRNAEAIREAVRRFRATRAGTRH